MNTQEMARIISLAFQEDRIQKDLTSLACLPPGIETEAHLVLKEKAYVAGLIFLPQLFQMISPKIDVSLCAEEGKAYPAKTTLAKIRGEASSLLAAERTALNILQHTSSICTRTRQYVEAIQGLHCDILDTRKTLPGLRALQKYAVRLGGGKNHRFSLEEQILIKSPHLMLLQEESEQPVREAIRRAKMHHQDVRIEIETKDLQEVEGALCEGVDAIMLDNMTVEQVKEAVQLIQGRCYVEASGGITLDTVRAYAKTGVNGISIGALTHSCKAVDISLCIENRRK